ncbi:MAG: mitomycin resistance protein [Gammaproteobacteria bacterium]|nr:MAG: mitomycin resistance protein [Gammaproteobacteria bacterium]
MNPNKVDRNRVERLTDLPNIGPAMAHKLHLLGIHRPTQLQGKSPYDLYTALCQKTGSKCDPCVLDIFIAVTRFVAGDEPKHWWAFTQERKHYIRTHSNYLQANK